MGNNTPFSFAVFGRPLRSARAAPRAQVITFGDGWVVEHGRMLDACGRDVRSRLGGSAAACTCEAPVPLRVRLFGARFLRQGLEAPPLPPRPNNGDLP